MSKPFHSGLAPDTSEQIYKQLLNVGTPTARKTKIRGKINKRPVFSPSKNKGHEQDSDLLPLEFYNFHYNASPTNGTLRGDDGVQDLRKQHNTSPCPSVEDNVQEDSMVKMLKIRATSAYVKNPECYQRNPELFMSSTPTEKRNIGNQQPVVWNNSHQALRLNKEWSAKAQCRATKRHLELMRHRTDKMYILNGAALSLENRYCIPDGEAQHLKELALARQELRNDLQEAREIHNRSRNISALRSRSRAESVKLPRLSAKSKNLVTESKSRGMTMPQVVPSNTSNLQNKGFARKGSETRCITVEGTYHPVDQQNDEIKAETTMEQRVVGGDCDDGEHTTVDNAPENNMKLASEDEKPKQPVPEDGEHIDPKENDVGVNECNASGVDFANNIDIEMTNNAEIDTTPLHNNGDPANNQYDEEAEVALQFYGKIEGEDDDADRLSIDDDIISYQNTENYNT